MNAATLMDKQYRYQRYVYDWSRKYYLFGRDLILRQIDLKEDETLLEMGCGTGRNLFILSSKHPNNHLFGIDASEEMLLTARKKLNNKLSKNKPNQYSNISLQQGLASELKYHQFILDKPFNHILFSYVLSMIPAWQGALDVAIENLQPNGVLHIVDFSDQKEIPAFLRRLLRLWLHLFHVKPNNDILLYLKKCEERGLGTLSVKHLYGRYSYLVSFTKSQ